jgi:phage FluMu protein Com
MTKYVYPNGVSQYIGLKANVYREMQADMAAIKCDNCERLFGDHTAQEFSTCLHKLLGPPNPPRPIPCSHCGKLVSDHSTEELHSCARASRPSPEEAPQVICPVCQKPFPMLSAEERQSFLDHVHAERRAQR